ncbi:hypothetical protein NTGBS_600007 [Candidatus Nitrotoga sp. BS]|nr:hypothetical protein NTGBS_600007 [Candidatus Nitrotoga sp. BS]
MILPAHTFATLIFSTRIVYEVFTKGKVVRIPRMWTHYECANAKRLSLDREASHDLSRLL